ncbi:MAG: Do family serine endopeptidase [Candidatus Rokubacteria bacterium]|nr:Do family serine endopeptidase [Candidatus Rokubacteria bacterium]
MRRWQTWLFTPLAVAVALVAVLAGAFVLTGGMDRLRWQQAVQRQEPVLASPRSGGVTPEGWTGVAKAAMPAVVNIATSRGGERRDLLRFFLGDPDAGAPRAQGLGSGVIVTQDGYVLTNNHVVEGARQIVVTLADRRELKGALVGADPKTDLAVVKLPASGLPALVLASGRAEVAEVVLAIGSPFGLTQTVTQGIVSAIGRANLGIADYEDFIQTDAAINPGNSGGALVNARGELIGINTAIVSQTGGSSGIGFAVPTTMARQVLEHVVKNGKVTRGYLGVSVQEATPRLTRALNVAVERGIVVVEVVPDGPAARAGLRRGDVITAVDGTPVDDVGQFRNLVAATPPGTRVTLTFARERERAQQAEVVVGELSDRAPAVASSGATPGPLGLAVTEATPEVARRLGVAPGTRGVVVADVTPGSRAAQAGIRPGDVILEVNRQPVGSVEELTRAFLQAKDGDLVVLVNRRGAVAYIPIERG